MRENRLVLCKCPLVLPFCCAAQLTWSENQPNYVLHWRVLCFQGVSACPVMQLDCITASEVCNLVIPQQLAALTCNNQKNGPNKQQHCCIILRCVLCYCLLAFAIRLTAHSAGSLASWSQIENNPPTTFTIRYGDLTVHRCELHHSHYSPPTLLVQAWCCSTMQ